MKIAEHTDFFVKLKAYGLKVRICESFQLFLRQSTNYGRMIMVGILGRKGLALINLRFCQVVYCDDLMILNQQEKGDDKDYHKLRYNAFS